MGIFIKLEIVPNKISKTNWEATYLEAIQLIRAYPFLDIVSDSSMYDCKWVYADGSSERPIPYCDNHVGFRMIGDLRTMERAESFELIRDFDYYLNLIRNRPNQQCEDVLSYYLDEFLDLLSVFDSKTQGYDYHQPILAIACLFEDRLQPYALVHGDISRGQMEEAIQWANGILNKPIQLSKRANNEVLLQRIKKITLDGNVALETFMKATLNALDHQLGAFIRENFSKEAILQSYRNRIEHCKIGTLGFSDMVDEYLNLCHDLGDLCTLCIHEKNHDPEDIQSFIKQILNLGIYLNGRHS